MTTSEDRAMWPLLWGLAFAVIGGGLGYVLWSDARPVSDRSFDEIKQMVEGKSASEVVEILGDPQHKEKVFGHSERWIWWRYTTLEGSQHAPELRGQIVHLEVVFRNPSRPGEAIPYSGWSIDEVNGVEYRLPSPAAPLPH
ncbi:MAG: hypothetical protein GY719_05880 [bacterium]|nr:hypothetical protein [bacterium]